MQDFTGVPCIVDLATMREAVTALGGDPAKINPLSPAEMVIDHSVIADLFGTENALERNVEIEYERNGERYQFLRWGQTAFDDFKVVPPGTGIVHQVNIEHLAKVIYDRTGRDGVLRAYPDTCVGTDSHTTMVNGLGVLGWGVGGIEAEAAMLGQPVSMLIPRVVGFKLTGEIPAGDGHRRRAHHHRHAAQARRRRQVRRVLRQGRGLRAARQPRHHRQHEPGVRLDRGDLPDRRRHARLPAPHGPRRADGGPRRGVRQGAEALARRRQRAGLQRVHGARPLDGRAVDRRPEAPQDRILLSEAKTQFEKDIVNYTTPSVSNSIVDLDSIHSFPASDPGSTPARRSPRRATSHLQRGAGRGIQPRAGHVAGGESYLLDNGAVTLAAITSCTNTSNPSVMIAAGLLARKARNKGLKQKPWVKTTLGPGSKVVTDYYEKSGLDKDLEGLGFYTVGYGCTICIGNSGPSSKRSRRRSTRTTSPSRRCSRATATSRAASAPT
jgi:aconitate hydratase